jgi:hypothetical protein
MSNLLTRELTADEINEARNDAFHHRLKIQQILSLCEMAHKYLALKDEPGGWVSVPLEPTEKMIEMGMEKSCLGRPSVDDERYVLSIWKAMLAAKPSRG